MSRAWHPSGQHGDVVHAPEDDCVNCGSCRPSRWNTSPLIIPSAPAKATRAAKPSGLSAMFRPAGRRRDADVMVVGAGAAGLAAAQGLLGDGLVVLGHV